MSPPEQENAQKIVDIFDLEQELAKMPDVPEHSDGEEWELAQQRVLLYLHALDVPVVQRLELALEVLKRAIRNASDPDHAHPVAIAMRILHQLITEQDLHNSTKIAFQLQSRSDRLLSPRASSGMLHEKREGQSATHDGQYVSSSLVVAPPMSRSPMVPENIDRKPWRRFFSNRFGRSNKELGESDRNR